MALLEINNLVINKSIIERVSHFNFLGIMLSYNMTWDTHINHISKKISKAIGILYQLKSLKPIYPQPILFTLYTTLIVPHLNYRLILWGSCIKKKTSTALTPKEVAKNNYKQSLHNLFRTNFQSSKMFNMFSVAIW